MKKIIFISGKAGSGKTTLANNLIDKFEEKNKYGVKISFADPLREIVYGLINKIHIYQDDDDFKQKYYRPLMQTIGQTARLKNESFWVDKLISLVSEALNSDEYDYVIIDDARYVNEINCFDENENLEIFKIRIEGNDESENVVNTLHSSETSLDNYNKFDLIIDKTTRNNLNNIIKKIGKDEW